MTDQRKFDDKISVIQQVLRSYENQVPVAAGVEEIESYVQSYSFLNDILKQSNTCFFIVEYNAISYLYCSPNVTEMFGRPAEEFLKGGPQFTLSMASIEDLAVHQRIHARIVDLFRQTPEEARQKTKFSFTLRLTLSDGRTINLLQNNFFLKWSPDGQPLVKLFTVTDITMYKPEHSFMLFVTELDDNGNSKIVLQEDYSDVNKELISGRELEVLRLAATGLSAGQSGDKLGISEGTIKVHRKSIVRKLGATNFSQAVTLASLCGLL